MASTTFTYQNAIDAARVLIQDKAKRAWPDADLIGYWVPRVLEQLRSDRPDLFHGNWSFTRKPLIGDLCQFDDTGFNAFVQALIAAIRGASSESVNQGQAQLADQQSERGRRA